MEVLRVCLTGFDAATKRILEDALRPLGVPAQARAPDILAWAGSYQGRGGCDGGQVRGVAIKPIKLMGVL